jgi:hypothetical protein
MASAVVAVRLLKERAVRLSSGGGENFDVGGQKR